MRGGVCLAEGVPTRDLDRSCVGRHGWSGSHRAARSWKFDGYEWGLFFPMLLEHYLVSPI